MKHLGMSVAHVRQQTCLSTAYVVAHKNQGKSKSNQIKIKERFVAMMWTHMKHFGMSVAHVRQKACRQGSSRP
jgi:hypothetical protein